MSVSVTAVLTGKQLMEALRVARKIVESGDSQRVKAIAEVGEMVRCHQVVPADVWDECVQNMYLEQGELMDAAVGSMDDVQVVAFGRTIASGVYVFVEAR